MGMLNCGTNGENKISKADLQNARFGTEPAWAVRVLCSTRAVGKPRTIFKVDAIGFTGLCSCVRLTRVWG